MVTSANALISKINDIESRELNAAEEQAVATAWAALSEAQLYKMMYSDCKETLQKIPLLRLPNLVSRGDSYL